MTLSIVLGLIVSPLGSPPLKARPLLSGVPMDICWPAPALNMTSLAHNHALKISKRAEPDLITEGRHVSSTHVLQFLFF